MDERAVAIDNMRPAAAALTDAGIATWNIEYRRLGHPGGGWPGTFLDVARAADFLRTLASENTLDLARVRRHRALGRRSFRDVAGGSRQAPENQRAVHQQSAAAERCRRSGWPTDLKATIPLQQPICGSPVITNLLGGSPEERPDRYRAGSPIELLPLGVRQEFFAGRMFGAQVAPYEAAARRAGDSPHTTLLADVVTLSSSIPNRRSGHRSWPRRGASSRCVIERTHDSSSRRTRTTARGQPPLRLRRSEERDAHESGSPRRVGGRSGAVRDHSRLLRLAGAGGDRLRSGPGRSVRHPRAGNIVASSQVGSVEFAAARYGTRLVVVLGHSQCGAVLATLEELQQPTDNQSRNLRSIVDRVRPSVEALLATELRNDPHALVRQAVRANVRVSANHLRHGSEILERLIQEDGLRIVGAEYSLETGIVDFFDGVT
jgi:carbonic anhydrase